MRRAAIIVGWLVVWTAGANAQTVSQRGFVEGREFVFPQAASNDPEHRVGDLLARDEVFIQPAEWFQIAAGIDFRANSHGQVEDEWRLDFDDRGLRRPKLATRRLSATFKAGGLSVEVGKQYIRWARVDVLNPLDRFAPRDFMNVIDTEFLPVTAARAIFEMGTETVDAVWVPWLTPSRLPLPNQRWAALPSGLHAAGLPAVEASAEIPNDAQFGFRWSHAGQQLEVGASYFDGFNHLPSVETRVRPEAGVIDVTRVYPALRSYGGDVAVPTAVITLKGEAAYVTSPTSAGGKYFIYVLEMERQTGEWVLGGGYAGEAFTTSDASQSFAPDRGVARSIIGRASYTVDPRRTVNIEGALRQTTDGFYVKGEYSQTWGQHWRLTGGGVVIRGDATDFLGQFARNSNGSIAMRFSF